MVKVMAFRDYAREVLESVPKLGVVRRDRMLEVVRRLSAIDLGMRSRPPTDATDVVAAIYRGVGDRTIRRDLNLLLEHELIIERDSLPAANVPIMDEFTPD
jgi:hypothetical protein